MVCVGNVGEMRPPLATRSMVLDLGQPLGLAHVALLPLLPGSTCRPDLGWHALGGGSCVRTATRPGRGPIVWCTQGTHDPGVRLGGQGAANACGTALGALLGLAASPTAHVADPTQPRGCLADDRGWFVNTNHRLYLVCTRA